MKEEIRSKLKRSMTPTRLIALSFAVAILAGALILMLPVSSADGTWTAPIDAFFTAATSICVTGLVTVTTAYHWSIFGQFIILILAQVGGLSVITVYMCILAMAGKRLTLHDRMLIQETYNMDTMDGLTSMIRRIVKYTLAVESVGAVLYSIAFIPRYGVVSGIWKAIFNAVSAFCNAGLDILGGDSLRSFVTNPLVNITTMLLIILGGLGFVVWWDVIKAFRTVHEAEEKRSVWKLLSLHSKFVLMLTGALLCIGSVLFFIFEFNNPDTIGELGIGGKILASIFQSVTTRTAGFETVPQGSLTNASLLLCMVLMIIGGSPAGTAGGIKTTTVGILLVTVISATKGKKDTEVLNRRIPLETVKTAVVLVMMAFSIVFTATMILFVTEDMGFAETLFEVCSAMGTVGLSMGVTSSLSWVGKLVIMFVMYIGRTGPVTLVFAFARKRAGSEFNRTLPEGRIMIS